MEAILNSYGISGIWAVCTIVPAVKKKRLVMGGIMGLQKVNLRNIT